MMAIVGLLVSLVVIKIVKGQVLVFFVLPGLIPHKKERQQKAFARIVLKVRILKSEQARVWL